MLPLIMKRHALWALLLTLLISFTFSTTALGATTTKSMSSKASLADGIKVGAGVLLGFGGDADTTLAGGFGSQDYEMEATAGASL